jgi:calcium-dependent protein kinase
LLTYDYKKRISAEEALKDEFIVTRAVNRSQLTELVSIERLRKPFENLRKFNAKQKLQQATIAFLVHHVSSTDMVKDLRNIFKELDENGDGTLSYDEIRKGFVKFYKDEKIAEKEMEEIIKKIDQDGNDCIEYEEFIRATVNLEVLLTERNLMLAFKAFDKNNDSELSHQEIKSALGVIELGEEENNNDIIKQIIAEIDINNDGNISFQEFKQLMIKVLEH